MHNSSSNGPLAGTDETDPVAAAAPAARTGRLLCWLLFGVLLLGTGWAVLLSHAGVEQRRRDVFTAETSVLQLRLAERLVPYQALSRNLVGLFLASESIELSEWSVFVLALQPDRHLLHLENIWFAYAADNPMAAHYRRQHGRLVPSPPTDAVRSLPLLYVYPVTTDIGGHDIYPANGDAVELAYTRRETTLATRLQLYPDTSGSLAFITPFFRQQELATSPRPALEGLLGVSLSAESLLGSLLAESPPGLQLALHAGDSAEQGRWLFASDRTPATAADRHFERIEHLEIDGQPLTLSFHAPRNWDVVGIDRRLPYYSALGGLLISLLGFGIARSLENTRERAQAIATRMTVELRRANRALREMATTDGLTGLLNRRAFFEQLHDALARARRYPHPCAVLLLDIDHFKAINDTHGHPAGDAVLRAVGGLLRTELRATDVAARIGGEEFAVLLPHTGSQAALSVAEQLRAGLQRLEYVHGEHRFGCTASFGVAVADVDDSPDARVAESLLQHADRALYAAKRGGRNRVELAAPPSTEAAPVD